LLEDRDRVEVAAGTSIDLAKIAVAHPFKPRPVSLPRGILTTDPLSVACDLDVDVVIEVIGGIEPPRQLIHAAIADGKSVITANKELLAAHGPELFAAAERKSVHLHYEAAACGAVPIIRCLSESLSAAPLRRVTAILNGTTNFILSEMEIHGCSVEDALLEAQRRGYAEADPSADITGRDAASKAILLATIASGRPPALGKLEGITGVTQADIASAKRDARTLKLVAEIDLRSTPAATTVTVEALPASHPLSHVAGVNNGVVVETTDGTELFFSGPGAGGDATAVAVIGDLVRVAKDRTQTEARRRLVCA